ncbi:MAG: cadherin domain-containing protein [Lentimicrobiaceae bacterium]|nr:cadherin domain-containing protein [Lentimicrobiaceae bacterium]
MENKTTLITNGSFTFGPKLKFLTLTFALIVFYTTLLFSATIYIDPSSNNSNPNGSMSNPYKSWAGVNFVNGNSYVQKRGTTYTSSSYIYINGRNNITIGSYGTGSLPKFSYTGSGHAFRLENSSSCIIEDFDVNGNTNAVSLVYVSGTSGNYASNNIIRNCNLYNAHNSNNGGFGIYGFYNHNLKMLNTDIHNVALDGVYLKFATNLEIGYCNIYDINRRYFSNSNQTYSSGDGVQLDGTYNGFHIHHTTIDRTNGAGNKYNLILNSAAGLSDNATGIIEYNTFINSDNIAYAVLIERGNGIITRYNTFKGSTGGIRLGGAYTKNNLIHHNIFYNCTTGVGIGYTYPSAGPCTGTKVYNNVFYHVTSYHIWVDKTNVVTRNNIHYRTNDSGVALYNYGGGSWTISNNCYGTSATAGSPGAGSGAVTGNPLFINPSTYNFRLQSNSPCINKGMVVNLSHDLDGNTIFSGSAPDIGAYELTNSTGSNQAPLIGNQTFSVMSNASNGTTVGTVVASDPDAGQTLTYAITAGNTGNAFSIIASTGVLKVNNAAALSASSFALTVKVTDNGSPSMNASATVTVNVTQANRAPVISNQTFSVMSNASNGTTVGTVIASDPDAGQTLTYAITAGNTGNAFSIVASTGVLKVNNTAALSASSFALTVKVTDNGSPSMNASATVTVNVTQANQAPVISNQSFSVMPNASNGTTVGTVIASDPDAGQTLTYAITAGNTGNAFSIVASTGVLKVNNAAALTVSSFALTVKVTDNGSPSMNASATVTVNVTQANQAPVISNQSFSVMSNASNGTTVGTVVASDPDAGQTLTYAITAGNTGNAFSIVASTGVLKVNNAAALTVSSFALTVKVTDNGSPSLNASATVTVNVTQANQAPVITNQTFDLQQTAAQGTLIGIIQASDPNAGQTLTYTIISGNSNGIFGLNSGTGALTVLIPEGLTPGPKYLDVRVTDNGSPSMYTEAVITIDVISTNNAPIMTAQTFVSAPYPPVGSTLGIIEATDPDPGQTLTFSIVSGNSFGIFNINSATGAITVGMSYPLYPRNFYMLARVTDDGNPSLYTDAWINIKIQSINNPPIVQNQTFTLLSGSPQGTVVGTIIASDPDPGQRVTFAFESGNSFNIFNLNEATGEITVNLQGAIYPRNFYMTARVTDNGVPSASSTAIICISVLSYTLHNVNNIPNQSFVAKMDNPEGTVIGNIELKDVSTAESVIFVIEDEQSENRGFSVDPVTGVLMIADQSALNPGLSTLDINILSKDQHTVVARTKANILVKSANIMGNNTQDNSSSPFEAKVYPNPSTDGKFNLSLTGDSNDEFIIQIADLSGRILREPMYTRDNHLEINLSDQPKGTYLFIVQYNGFTRSIKALKN